GDLVGNGAMAATTASPAAGLTSLLAIPGGGTICGAAFSDAPKAASCSGFVFSAGADSFAATADAGAAFAGSGFAGAALATSVLGASVLAGGALMSLPLASICASGLADSISIFCTRSIATML